MKRAQEDSCAFFVDAHKEKVDRVMQKKKLYLMIIHYVIWILVIIFAVMTLALIICFVFESDISSSEEMFDLINKLVKYPQMTSFLSKCYKNGYDFLMRLDMGNKLDDFNLMLSMEMICSAVIVFLYSRFSENVYGLPIEYLIRYGIGHLILSILRIAALVLPFVCFFSFLRNYMYTVFFSLLVIYIIISILVLLCLEMMQKENTIALTKNILKREWKSLNRKRKCIIPVFFRGNYLKINFFNKTELCTSAEIHHSLSWEAINFLLSDKNLELKIEMLQEIFFLLSWFGKQYQDVDFINLFNITYGMLETKNLGDPLKLNTLRIFVLKLNGHQKNKEELYEEKYCAIILAILYSQKKEALEYLWGEFFHGLNQRDRGLKARLYIFSYKILEILIVKGIVSEFSLNLALNDKANLDYLKSHYMVSKCKNDQSELFNMRLSFLLSVVGIMDQEIAMKCLIEFDRDMLRKNTCYKTGFWIMAR